MIRLHKAGVIAALNLLVVAGLAAGAGPASAAQRQPGAPQPTNQYPGYNGGCDQLRVRSLTTVRFLRTLHRRDRHGEVSSALNTPGAAQQMFVTTAAGSVANFPPLPAGSNEVTPTAGSTSPKRASRGNNVPYFRFFNKNTRFVDVYRSNGGAGPLWLRVAAPDGTLRYTAMKANVRSAHGTISSHTSSPTDPPPQ